MPLLLTASAGLASCASPESGAVLTGLAVLGGAAIGGGVFAAVQKRDRQLGEKIDGLLKRSRELGDKRDWKDSYDRAEEAYGLASSRISRPDALRNKGAVDQYFKASKYFLDKNRFGNGGGCDFLKECERKKTLPFEMIPVAMRYGKKEWALDVLLSAADAHEGADWIPLTVTLFDETIEANLDPKKRLDGLERKARFLMGVGKTSEAQRTYWNLAFEKAYAGDYPGAYEAMALSGPQAPMEVLEGFYERALIALEDRKNDDFGVRHRL